jgi:NAD(P)-dependent dehydrogenase (short-subunit alcohol dehydrogenase family)
MRRVAGKVALVTGAGLGLGRASALMLAREGARVAVTDVKEQEGRTVADEIIDAGGEAIFIRHDVSSEADWENAIATTLRRFGRLDILVNNAGVLLQASAEEMTLEQWRSLMAVNSDGAFLGTKHAIRAMRDKGGSIVNISSVAGMVGLANLGAYCASKGAVRLFTKAAALECATAGGKVRVNSIHPGGIWTPMLEAFVGRRGEAAADAAAADMHPIGHAGEPDDIAYGVLYLASDESKFVTGAELVIDGGYTAQ